MVLTTLSKSRFSKILIFSILLVAFVVPVMKSAQKVYAAMDAGADIYGNYISAYDIGNFYNDGVYPTTATPAASITNATIGQGTDIAAYKGANNINAQPSFGCFGSGTLDAGKVPSCIAAGTYYIIFVPTYWIAGWMGMFFNYALFLLVIGMGNLVRTLTGVMTAWATLRDLANVFLVFITVYVGIATILGISGYGYKKLLWKILLAALLVNFSATFTKGVIDVSNIFALETFKLFTAKAGGPMTNPKCLDQNGKPDASNPCLSIGIAGSFWSALKITSLFNLNAVTTTAGNTAKANDLTWNLVWVFLMGGMMFLVLAFVFGGAAVLLVGRFVILVFLIIVSPVALTAWITGISSQGSKWWSTLINQSMFAPLVLLMWWIALQVTQGVSALMGTGSLSSGADPSNVSALAIVVMFIIIMGFLIMSLVFAKQLGAYGAGAVIKVGNNMARGAAAGLVAYPAGYMATKAAQGYTRKVAKSQEVDEEGNYKHTGLKNIGSYVHRGIAKVGPLDRGINRALEAPAKTSFLGTSSYAQRKEASQKAASERQTDITKQGNEGKINDAVKTLNSSFVNDNANSYTDNEAKVRANQKLAEARKTIASASTAEIEQMRAKHGNLGNTDATRSALTQKQASALAGRAGVTPQEKAKLTETAFKGEREAMRTQAPTQAHVDKLQSTSYATIKDNASVLKSNPHSAAHLSPQVFKQIQENKDEIFDADTLKSFADTRKTHLESLDQTSLKNVITKTKPADLIEFDVDLLKKPEFIHNVDTQTLNQMQRNGLTKEKRDAMKAQIETMYNALPSPGSGAGLTDHLGRPIPPRSLTPEEQNITNLHKWFENDARPSIN